jgi:spoIIIJ-associated protein
MKLELSTIEAPTLEEAYTKASEELNCSITDLEAQIVQNPSKGFLGFGKKNAIIVVARKYSVDSHSQKLREHSEKKERYQQKNEDRVSQKKPIYQNIEEITKIDIPEEVPLQTVQESVAAKTASAHFDRKFSGIENSFFDEKKEIAEVCAEIEIEINKLFGSSCFELEKITVTPDDEQTVMIKFSGLDSALLIGKEGYRYNALAYLLFNWINPKFRVGVKLEIAEFLQNQEEMIRKYIESVIAQVRSSGYARTKPLDGILLQIAIKELRVIFPEKYVGVKSSDNGLKFVVINDFARK